MNDDCIILGSGRSLLGLTPDERAYLNSHPRTLGMNKYLLFWKKLGVLPAVMFLADFKPPGVMVFHETIRIIRTLGRDIPFYVNAEFIRFFCERTDRVFIESTKAWWKRDYGYEPDLSAPVDFAGLRPFLVRTEQKTFQFAAGLDQVLYHRRGSLTTAINLAAILWPRSTIKLLGVDLGDPGYFFDEEIQAQRPELIDASYRRAKELGRHNTALPSPKFEGTVQEALAAVAAHLTQIGSTLVCCNPGSLLVREGVCRHQPLIS